MTETIRIALAQYDFLVGDIEGNAKKIVDIAQQAAAERADMVVFPELALTGYPPEDLLLRPALSGRVERALQTLFTVEGIDIVVGAPRVSEGQRYNQALVIRCGQIVACHSKQQLPNYLVFDEKRYFSPGQHDTVWQCGPLTVGLTVCEEIWYPDSLMALKAAGAQLVVNLSASPFHSSKNEQRHETARQRCQESGLALAYVNLVGGQDELLFDGGSFAMNADGQVAASAPTHTKALFTCQFDLHSHRFVPGPVADRKPRTAAIYDSLVLGVRDYVNNNGFSGVVIGLSGGIDSALTLAIAVDALGPDRVEAVMMPFEYTAQISREDAASQADTMAVAYQEIPIKPMVDACTLVLAEPLHGYGRDVTEENLQARCRAVVLMALANKKRRLVLTTGNKSEMAVGYATLYGDMAGGFDVLKDVLKTEVVLLAQHRNSRSPVIPRRVIERPPSAELAPDQVDQDTLPSYPVLDAVLERYIVDDLSAEAIVAEGFDRETVYRVVSMVDRNEYKRRQAAIGVRISRRGFGRDRRYPITQGWQPGE